MKPSLENEKELINQFKDAVKEAPFITLSEVKEVIRNYETLIEKLKAYQEIINEVLGANVNAKG